MRHNIKLILAGLLSLALLLLCAALPEFIRNPAGEPGSTEGPGPSGDPASTAGPGSLTLDRRAAYFARFFVSDETLSVQREYNMPVSEKAASAIRAVTELFLIDTAENPTVTKEEETHYVLNTGDGDAIRLVKYEKRWEGLWENYFTIDADADTGAVYYFYASSFPLQTLDSFQNVNGVPETLNEMLTAFAALTGLEMSGAYVKTGQVTYTQAFSDGESTVTYDIYFSYVPAKLLDVKMTIRGG